MKWCLLLAVIVISTTNSDEVKSGPIVDTPNGRVEGVYKKYKDYTFMKFDGIPYAKPPIRELRFAPPEPMNPWTGTWKADTQYICIQIEPHDDGVNHDGILRGSEDCLYLNVLTPGETINPEVKLDVIVNFHGGAFMFGNPAYLLPTTLMDRNIVYVSMNYRVGIMGFMSLEDSYLPGNLGMKDQVMALEWVRDNIQYFGGNPDSVTITGLSAGAASVHFHMLSPMSKGLFHKAISTSGNALDPWAIHEAPRQKAEQVGKSVGCLYKNSKDFLRCLKTRPAEQIVEVTKQFMEWIGLPFAPFSLVVDNNAKVPFLPEHPYKLLQAGEVYDVPWLASITSGEGLCPVGQLAYKEEYFDILEKNFEKYLPPLLHYELSVPQESLNNVTKAIRKEYLKEEAASFKTFKEIIQMTSDRLFNNGMEKSIRLHSKAVKSPVYFYFYDYIPEKVWSFTELIYGYKEKYGVSHGDDILMIFECPHEPSKNDVMISDFLISTWVEFAKNGKTTRADWKPLAHNPTEEINYMFIGGPEKIEMYKTQDFGNKAFWNSLPFIENENLLNMTGIVTLINDSRSEDVKSVPIVETPSGRVEGAYKKFKDGTTTYMQFDGIPYAMPPVGERRFAPPQPMTPWTGTWKADTQYVCIQIGHDDDGVNHDGVRHGSEDCLYLNILTPGETINPEANLDVIVHIHGGAFMFGSSAYTHPKPFMDRNVVFVSLNYRLGIFGFMSLEDSYLPGNLGMRDQVMALEWIRDNINYFGGNPDSVTITGLSAGGASVHFHLLSPMSKGLFHKAISASGNALDPWAIHEAPRQKAKQVGKAVGCLYENSKDFLACLKTRSAEQIVEVTKQFREWIFLPFSPFGLVVDNNAKKPFLPEHPYKLLEAGKVYDIPWLASVTSGEGLYPVAQLACKEEYFDILEKNFEKYLPPLLHYEMSIPKKSLNDVTNAIRKEYLKGARASLKTFKEIIQMASDRLFNIGMEKSIRLHSKAVKSPVYFYFYDYTPEKIWSLSEVIFGYKEKYGVSHADDILVMFECPMEPSKNDAKIRDFLIRTWVEFAKTGKTIRADWKPLSDKPTEGINYLYIDGPENMEVRKSKDFGNKAFWDSLPFIENENLSITAHKDEL